MIPFRLLFRGSEGEYERFVEQAMAAQAQLASGTTEEEELLTPEGTPLLLSTGPEGEFQCTGAGGGVEVAGFRFPGTEDRPPSYPNDAPFLPMIAVSVTEIPKNGWRSLSWHQFSDPEALIEEIRRQLEEAGWVAGRRRRLLLGFLGVEQDFKKGGVTQRLVLQKLPGGRRKLLLIRRSGGREYEDRVLDGSGPLSAGSRAASTVFGLACGVLALVSILETSPSSVPGWFGVLILAMGGFHFLRVGLSSRPRFEITEDGFIDRRFIGGGELHLEWDEIRDVRQTRFGGQLEVFVRDPAAVRARAGWPRKLWMYLGALYGKNSYSIHPWYVGPNLVELRKFMERRMLELERSRIGLSAASEQSPGLPSTGRESQGFLG